MKSPEEIIFDKTIIIKEIAIWMDGGSVTVKCQNEIGHTFDIEFVQNVIWDYPTISNVTDQLSLKIPGRLYLNDQLIDIRSNLEERIIQSIETADKVILDETELQILDEKVKYIKSDSYLRDQEKLRK